jgi:O-antigen ligase
MWIVRYLGEGVLVYLLFINLIRSTDSLRRVTWLLVLCGALLASLTAFQELTGSYRTEFGGLAGRNLEFENETGVLPGSKGRVERGSVRLANRAQGPIDDPNRYAQILIVLLPLAWCLIRTDTNRTRRGIAAASAALIVAGVLLTYSRGGFVGLILMAALMCALRMVKVWQVATVAIAISLSVAILNPGYADRMRSLLGIGGIFSGPSTSGVAPDAVERGRATHMLAAWKVFLDHPIIGTGPGQFSGVYSVDYSSEFYAVRRVTEPRRAHSLYLELAAETGVIGFSVFMAIVIVTLRRLVTAWHRTTSVDAFLANMSLACVVAVFAYLATALFLQLSFQRYYWFLLALAGATVLIAESRTREGGNPSASPQAG